MCSFFSFQISSHGGSRRQVRHQSLFITWGLGAGGGRRGEGVGSFGWEQRGGGSVVANRVEMGDYRKLTVN